MHMLFGTSRRALTALVVLVALSAMAVAAGSEAAPKPGFPPGTWKGTGTIRGSVTDGPLTTHFQGRVGFTLVVSKAAQVKGTGRWTLRMLGSEDAPGATAVDSTLEGRAAITLGGSPTGITYAGLQKVVGELRMGHVSRPLSFERPLKGALVITKARSCRVHGTSTVQPGVTLTWSAKLAGVTCTA